MTLFQSDRAGPVGSQVDLSGELDDQKIPCTVLAIGPYIGHRTMSYGYYRRSKQRHAVKERYLE